MVFYLNQNMQIIKSFDHDEFCFCPIRFPHGRHWMG